MGPAVYPERSRRGYTLIELLVVISILSLLGVVSFVNFKDFAADQVATKASGQIQTYLRLAQSNATSSTLCGSQAGVSWTIVFPSATSVNIICGPSDLAYKSLNLENASAVVKGSGCSSATTPTSANPIKLTYSSRSGALAFTASDSCMQSSQQITFTISNTKNASSLQKTFIISKGGAINVQ